jgi:hypothetical protein
MASVAQKLAAVKSAFLKNRPSSSAIPHGDDTRVGR